MQLPTLAPRRGVDRYRPVPVGRGAKSPAMDRWHTPVGLIMGTALFAMMRGFQSRVDTQERALLLEEDWVTCASGLIWVTGILASLEPTLEYGANCLATLALGVFGLRNLQKRRNQRNLPSAVLFGSGYATVRQQSQPLAIAMTSDSAWHRAAAAVELQLARHPKVLRFLGFDQANFDAASLWKMIRVVATDDITVPAGCFATVPPLITAKPNCLWDIRAHELMHAIVALGVARSLQFSDLVMIADVVRHSPMTLQTSNATEMGHLQHFINTHAADSPLPDAIRNTATELILYIAHHQRPQLVEAIATRFDGNHRRLNSVSYAANMLCGVTRLPLTAALADREIWRETLGYFGYGNRPLFAWASRRRLIHALLGR